MRPATRRPRRWLLAVGISVLVVLGTAFAYLRTQLQGPSLGQLVANVLNRHMRGRIEIGSIEWPTSALKTVVSGGWIPFEVRNVKVWDDCALSAEFGGATRNQLRVGSPHDDCTPDDQPDKTPGSKRKPRKLLLNAPRITAEIDIHALMFGRHNFLFRNAWVHGGEVLLEQTREPYPLHAYDRTIVSIVTAFYPRMKAGFRAGIFADTAPPIFDFKSMYADHLNVTIHMGPYTVANGRSGFRFTARVEDVTADATSSGLAGLQTAMDSIRAGAEPATAIQAALSGQDNNYLHIDPIDPLVAKLHLDLALRGGRSAIRIFDEGPHGSFRLAATSGASWFADRTAKYSLELSHVTLNRLEQMPAQRDPNKVANTLALDLTARTRPCGDDNSSDGADLHLYGELTNYWDRLYDGSWNLALDIKNAGRT